MSIILSLQNVNHHHKKETINQKCIPIKQRSVPKRVQTVNVFLKLSCIVFYIPYRNFINKISYYGIKLQEKTKNFCIFHVKTKNLPSKILKLASKLMFS